MTRKQTISMITAATALAIATPLVLKMVALLNTLSTLTN